MHETGFLDRVLAEGGDSMRYRVYVPAEPTAERRWPVILFLHGSGEGGTDGRRPTDVGIGHAIRRHPERFPAVVVFPQARRGEPWNGAMAERAMRALDASAGEFSADPERVYLTGISMGGYGAWRLALQHPDRFAALVPICGGLDAPERRSRRGAGDASDPFVRAARTLRHLPTWVFHGADDPVIPVTESRLMVDALRREGGNVRYTEYPGVEHGSWDPAYADPALARWLFAQRRQRADGG